MKLLAMIALGTQGEASDNVSATMGCNAEILEKIQAMQKGLWKR